MKGFILGVLLTAIVFMTYGAYHGLEPFSVWKLNIQHWSDTQSTPNTSPTVIPAKTTAAKQVWSHTGYIKSTFTGGNQTGVTFQDGFSVLLVGSLRQELLPSIGGKFEIKYQYDSQAGGNILVSIKAVS